MLTGQFDFNVSDDASSVFALNSEDFHRVSNTLNTSLRVYGCHNLMGYISGNHDRGRFISYASGSLKYGEDSKLAGWTRNIGVDDSTAYDKLIQLNAFNMTIPGVPVVYYGDEFGMPGGNDPDCRRMMRFDDDLVKREQEVLEAVGTLGQLRKNQLPLIYGDFIELTLDKNIWAYARNYFGKTVIVVFNRNTIPYDITIQLPAMFEGKKYAATFGSEFSLEKDILKTLVKANGVEVLVEQ
jgi:glycosidase